MKLNTKKTIFIKLTQPFHFDGTFHKPSHYPDELSDWESGKYWQSFRLGKEVFGIKIEDKKVKLKITIFSKKVINRIPATKIPEEVRSISVTVKVPEELYNKMYRDMQQQEGRKKGMQQILLNILKEKYK